MKRLNRRDTLKGLALGAIPAWGASSCWAAEGTSAQCRPAVEWPAVDVLVCGGGPAGIAAGMMAARSGAKTLLVERYGRLGGMAAQAMVGPLMGDVRSAWVDSILEHIGGRRVDYEFIDLKYAELLELDGRRQVQPILAFLKKHAPGFQNAYVSGMPAVIRVRETRRICGVASLTVEDLQAGRSSPRAVVRGASFPIDIQNPDGIGQAQGAQGVSAAHPLGKDPEVQPYDIPYDCLVPQRINGLLVAGRCISGSHEAMASYRVQVIATNVIDDGQHIQGGTTPRDARPDRPPPRPERYAEHRSLRDRRCDFRHRVRGRAVVRTPHGFGRIAGRDVQLTPQKTPPLLDCHSGVR